MFIEILDELLLAKGSSIYCKKLANLARLCNMLTISSALTADAYDELLMNAQIESSLGQRDIPLCLRLEATCIVLKEYADTVERIRISARRLCCAIAHIITRRNDALFILCSIRRPLIETLLKASSSPTPESAKAMLYEISRRVRDIRSNKRTWNGTVTKRAEQCLTSSCSSNKIATESGAQIFAASRYQPTAEHMHSGGKESTGEDPSLFSNIVRGRQSDMSAHGHSIALDSCSYTADEKQVALQFNPVACTQEKFKQISACNSNFHNGRLLMLQCMFGD